MRRVTRLQPCRCSSLSCAHKRLELVAASSRARSCCTVIEHSTTTVGNVSKLHINHNIHTCSLLIAVSLSCYPFAITLYDIYILSFRWREKKPIRLAWCVCVCVLQINIPLTVKWVCKCFCRRFHSLSRARNHFFVRLAKRRAKRTWYAQLNILANRMIYKLIISFTKCARCRPFQIDDACVCVARFLSRWSRAFRKWCAKLNAFWTIWRTRNLSWKVNAGTFSIKHFVE